MAVEIGSFDSMSSTQLLNKPSYGTDSGGLLESYYDTALVYTNEDSSDFTYPSSCSFDLHVSCSPKVLPVASGVSHTTRQTVGGLAIRSNDHTNQVESTGRSGTGSSSHVLEGPGNIPNNTVTKLQRLGSPIESKISQESHDLQGSGIHQRESTHPDTSLTPGVVEGQTTLGMLSGENKIQNTIALREHKPVKKPAFSSVEGWDTHPRKWSDPAVRLRKDWVRCSRMNRKWPDSPNVSQEEGSEEGEVSTQGCDSGYHDEIQSKSSKTHDGPCSPNVSDSEAPHDSTVTSRKKPTSCPLHLSQGTKDHLQSPVDERTRSLPRTFHHNKPKKPLLKSHSVGSIGGTSAFGTSRESLNLSSIWGFHSPKTVCDYLSGLGFEDFQSPQLVPDRFLSKNLEPAKPVLMQQQSIFGDLLSYIPPSPDSVNSAPSTLGHHHPLHTDTTDLPLGATANTLLMEATHVPSPTSPPPTDSMSNTTDAAAVYADPSISQINRGRAVLETVPEETASDLSPSPHWLSPRASMEDHSLIDVAEGKLGASLAVPKKKRLLRDGHEQSIGSQVDSEPESIFFTYDEIAKDREREETKSCPSLPLPSEDSIQQRRRYKGAYSPPPGLLTWLSTQHTIHEECPDPDELPWPFNEQAQLHKSLTDIQQSQQSPVITVNENSQNRAVCNDTLSCLHATQGCSEDCSVVNGPGRPLPSRHLLPDNVGDDLQLNKGNDALKETTLIQEVLDAS